MLISTRRAVKNDLDCCENTGAGKIVLNFTYILKRCTYFVIQLTLIGLRFGIKLKKQKKNNNNNNKPVLI